MVGVKEDGRERKEEEIGEKRVRSEGVVRK